MVNQSTLATIHTQLEHVLFEVNDTTLRRTVTEYTSFVLNEAGLQHEVKAVCNEDNNPPALIKANGFKLELVDIETNDVAHTFSINCTGYKRQGPPL